MSFQKTCSICGETKILNHFSTKYQKRRKAICKDCVNEEQRNRRRVEVPGYLYIITNPAWVDQYKVGITLKDNVEERLAQYQTSSPLRDYEVVYKIYVEDVKNLEAKVHRHYNVLNEWVKDESVDHVIKVINNLIDKHDIEVSKPIPMHKELTLSPSAEKFYNEVKRRSRQRSIMVFDDRMLEKIHKSTGISVSSMRNIISTLRKVGLIVPVEGGERASYTIPKQ